MSRHSKSLERYPLIQRNIRRPSHSPFSHTPFQPPVHASKKFISISIIWIVSRHGVFSRIWYPFSWQKMPNEQSPRLSKWKFPMSFGFCWYGCIKAIIIGAGARRTTMSTTVFASPRIGVFFWTQDFVVKCQGWGSECHGWVSMRCAYWLWVVWYRFGKPCAAIFFLG